MKKYKTNALYIKELKQSVRNIKFPITLGLYCFALAVIGLFTLITISSFSYPVYSSNTIKQDFVTFYSILFGFEFSLVIFIVPAITGGAISSERDRGTLELLIATTMGTYRIIMGKLIAVINKLLIYVVASLPILALIFTMGGVGMGDLISFILLFMFTSIYIGSSGILMSVTCRKTSTSLAVTYLYVIFITLGTIFAALMGDMITSVRNSILNPIYLLNPIVTLFSLLDSQIGLPEIIGNYVKFSKSSSYLMVNWLPISILVQLIVTIMNICLAAYLLNPFRGRVNK